MRRIPPHLLWIGNAKDGRTFDELYALGIEAIVQVSAEEPAIPVPREFTFLRFPLIDGAGNKPHLVRMALDSVTQLLRQRTPTLLCCGAGMSRSPAIAAAAISHFENAPSTDCLIRVTRYAPVDVAPGLWDELRHVLEPFR